MNPNLKAALDYLARGWSAIPLCPHNHAGVSGQHEQECKSPGKAPLWPWKQYQDKPPTPAALKLLFQRNKESNVGIAMGPVSGLFGIDIDQEGAFETLMGSNLWPETLEFVTPGGGRRLLFQWPTEGIHIKSIKHNGKEAIRILGAGSQTVAPPSTHWTGKNYAWSPGRGPEDIGPAPCPDWLMQALKPKGDDQEVSCAAAPPTQPASQDAINRAKAYLDKCDPAIAGQGGHNQTYKIAVKLVKGFGLSDEWAFSLLWERYNPRCQPPWTEKEIRHKIEDAMKSQETPGHLLNGHAPPPNHKAQQQQPLVKPAATTRPFAAIETKEVVWLWPGWIPLGKLTILDGDPGLGKSTMLLDIAARISKNAIMPDGTSGQAGHAILMSAEDAPEDTIRPRLEAAGADLSRIHDLSEVFEGEPRPPEIPRDIKLIEDKVKETGAKLLIIDPLMAFLYGADANKDQEIRRVLFKLSRMAEKHGCAVIAMRHLNKGNGGKAIYRGNSSIGVIGHARAGLLVAEDPDDSKTRVLAVTKCNLAAKPQSLTFVLDPVGNVCRVAWAGTTHYKADELVAPPLTEEEKESKMEHKTKLQNAMGILQALLQDGPQAIKDCKKECFNAGILVRTVERAAKKLKLDMILETDEYGGNKYLWSLPGGPGGPPESPDQQQT